MCVCYVSALSSSPQKKLMPLGDKQDKWWKTKV